MAPHKNYRDRPDFTERVLRDDDGDKNKGFRFERTFNFGHLLTALLMLAGGIGVWTNLIVVTSRQDTRLNYMERDQSKMADMLKQQAEIQYKLAGALEILARKQP